MENSAQIKIGRGHINLLKYRVSTPIAPQIGLTGGKGTVSLKI